MLAQVGRVKPLRIRGGVSTLPRIASTLESCTTFCVTRLVGSRTRASRLFRNHDGSHAAMISHGSKRAFGRAPGRGMLGKASLRWTAKLKERVRGHVIV